MRIEMTKLQVRAIEDLISDAESEVKGGKMDETIKIAKEFMTHVYCVMRREDMEKDTAERLRDFIQN